MKVKDLLPLFVSTQKIAIYEAVGEDLEAEFSDLYRGFPDRIPAALLARDALCMGVYDRGILEFQIKR